MNIKNYAFVAFTSLIVGCSEPSFEEQSRRIVDNLSDGNASTSLILAKNLLTSSVEQNNEEVSQQAKILLARTYFELGDYENALRFYSILEDKTPSNTTNDDRHRALFLAFELDQPEFSEFIIAKLKPRINNYEFQIYLHRNNQSNEKFSVPPSIQIHKFAALQLGQLTAKNDIADANQLFERLIEQDQKFAEAYLYKASINLALNNYDKALTSFIEFEKLKPHHPTAKLQVAAIAMQIGKPEVARPYIDVLTKLAPESPLILQLRGALALHDSDYKAAKRYSEQSIGLGLDSHINRLIAGMSNFRLKKWELANTNLRFVNDSLDSNHPARRMLIASKLALKDPESALALLNELNLNVSDITITNELTKQLLQKGDVEQAQALQDKISGLTNFNEALKQQNQQFSLSIQKQSVKKQLMNNVSDSTADDQEKVNLVLLYLSDRQFDEAQTVANSWYSDSPKNIHAINSLATVEMALGNKEKGATLLTEGLKVAPNNLPSLLFNLQTLKEKEDWKALEVQSQSLLDTLTYTNKNLFSYWLEALNNQSKLDLNTIVPRIKKDGDYELVFISGLFRKQQFTLLNDYLYQSLKQKNWQDVHWLMAIELTTREQKKLQSEQLITQYLTSGQSLNLDQIEFAIKHAMAFNNHPLVLKVVTDAKDTIGDTVSTLVPHVTSLLALEQVPQAQKLLSQYTIETPEYLEAQFELERKLGNMEQAWTSLNKSIKENPTLVKFAKLKSISDSPERMGTIKSLLAELAPVSVDEVLIRATASQWFISTDQPFAFYMLDTPRLEPLLNENFILANNFAWLLNERGEIERAKKFAQIALDAAPDNEQVIDTYNKVFGK